MYEPVFSLANINKIIKSGGGDIEALSLPSQTEYQYVAGALNRKRRGHRLQKAGQKEEGEEGEDEEVEDEGEGEEDEDKVEDEGEGEEDEDAATKLNTEILAIQEDLNKILPEDPLSPTLSQVPSPTSSPALSSTKKETKLTEPKTNYETCIETNYTYEQKKERDECGKEYLAFLTTSTSMNRPPGFDFNFPKINNNNTPDDNENIKTVINKYSELLDINDDDITLRIILDYLREKYYNEVPRILANIKDENKFNTLLERYIEKQSYKFKNSNPLGESGWNEKIDRWRRLITKYRKMSPDDRKKLLTNPKYRIPSSIITHELNSSNLMNTDSIDYIFSETFIPQQSGGRPITDDDKKFFAEKKEEIKQIRQEIKALEQNKEIRGNKDQLADEKAKLKERLDKIKAAIEAKQKDILDGPQKKTFFDKIRELPMTLRLNRTEKKIESIDGKEGIFTRLKNMLGKFINGAIDDLNKENWKNRPALWGYLTIGALILMIGAALLALYILIMVYILRNRCLKIKDRNRLNRDLPEYLIARSNSLSSSKLPFNWLFIIPVVSIISLVAMVIHKNMYDPKSKAAEQRKYNEKCSDTNELEEDTAPIQIGPITLPKNLMWLIIIYALTVIIMIATTFNWAKKQLKYVRNRIIAFEKMVYNYMYVDQVFLNILYTKGTSTASEQCGATDPITLAIHKTILTEEGTLREDINENMIVKIVSTCRLYQFLQDDLKDNPSLGTYYRSEAMDLFNYSLIALPEKARIFKVADYMRAMIAPSSIIDETKRNNIIKIVTDTGVSVTGDMIGKIQENITNTYNGAFNLKANRAWKPVKTLSILSFLSYWIIFVVMFLVIIIKRIMNISATTA